MSKYFDESVKLRSQAQIHYNCAQAVVVPFAEDAGISRETACRMTANFGGGMKMASVCGAVIGGVMVLGMFGVDDPGTIGDFYRKIKGNHEGYLDCANLLRINKETGTEKKVHCDKMIYECLSTVETILREKGKL